MKWLGWIIVFLLPLLPLLGKKVDYSAMSGEAQGAATEEIEKRFNAECISSGGGAMDVVRTLSLGFEVPRRISIETAREYLVDSLEIFLRHLNEHRELRPYLIEYPFPSRDLSISFLSDIDPSLFQDKHAYFSAMLVNDRIKYRFFETGKPHDIHQESLQEAQEIVRQQRVAPPLPKQETVKQKKSFFEILEDGIGDIFCSLFENEKYYGPPHERAKEWATDAYGEKIAKKYDLQFHREGNPSTVDYNYIKYGMDMWGNQRITLNEGRRLGAELMENFLAFLRHDPKVLKYHEIINEGYKTWKGPCIRSAEPVIEQICVRITYWDKKFDRYDQPYLAEILFLQGKFYYYEADPQTQRLKLVLTESYDDALAYRAGSNS